MNQKGFTLVEVLAVIVVLGILMTVAGTAVFQMLGTSKDKLLEEQLGSLGDTALIYVADKKYFFDVCPGTFTPKSPRTSLKNKCYREITVESLIQEGLFENKNDVCHPEKIVRVYREGVYDKDNPSKVLYSNLKTYIPEGTCEN